MTVVLRHPELDSGSKTKFQVKLGMTVVLRHPELDSGSKD